MSKLLSKFNDFAQWVDVRQGEIITAKVFEVSALCHGISDEETIRVVKGYIKAAGNSNIEFNQDYSKVRIYGKKQSIFELMK